MLESISLSALATVTGGDGAAMMPFPSGKTAKAKPMVAIETGAIRNPTRGTTDIIGGAPGTPSGGRVSKQGGATSVSASEGAQRIW